MPPPYSRKGLRGWMSIVSTRFPYKERRERKKVEIGLTWLTSTPLTPTRSKAEACQPLGVICAVCQRHGDKGAGILGDGLCGPMRLYPHPLISTTPPVAP